MILFINMSEATQSCSIIVHSFYHFTFHFFLGTILDEIILVIINPRISEFHCSLLKPEGCLKLS